MGLLVNCAPLNHGKPEPTSRAKARHYKLEFAAMSTRTLAEATLFVSIASLGSHEEMTRFDFNLLAAELLWQEGN